MSDLFNAAQIVEDEPKLVKDFLGVEMKAKELNPQISWVLTQRKTEYLDDLIALQKHSSVQVRRKIAAGLALLVKEESLQDLQSWQEFESDRETWLSLEATIDKVKRGLSGQDLESGVRIYSVSEAIQLVKKLIGEETYQIEGEISDLGLNRQMYYFVLKEGQETGLKCQLFAGLVDRIGFPLNEGLSVRVIGKFRLSKYSQLVFEIHKIQLTGEGELLRNLKLLEQKLQMEGIFNQDRKRSIKSLPEKILLIASPASAAIKDFLKVLQARRGGIEIYQLPIKTQGVGAEFDVLQALRTANKVVQKYDIDSIVITRGGGGKDDLAIFNSEKVVRAIHGLERPTVVAIGHERDVTLSEMAADLRASTPSNAAELVTLSRDQVLNQVSAYYLHLHSYFQRRKNEYQSTASLLSSRIYNKVGADVQQSKLVCVGINQTFTQLIFQVRNLANSITSQLQVKIGQEIRINAQITQQIVHYPAKIIFRIQNDKLSNQKIYQQIFSTLQNQLSLTTRSFENSANQIQLHDPKIVMARGFAVVSQNGEIKDSVQKIEKGQVILRMSDGEIELSRG